MESGDHIKSMYGEICFESVHSSPLGIFYVYQLLIILGHAWHWQQSTLGRGVNLKIVRYKVSKTL